VKDLKRYITKWVLTHKHYSKMNKKIQNRLIDYYYSLNLMDSELRDIINRCNRRYESVTRAGS